MKDEKTRTLSKVRDDFPFFHQQDLVYLDNSATTQKPFCVIEREKEFYFNQNANPFRGMYELSEVATNAYEDARKVAQHFLHAQSEKEIIFTRNATESLNLVAYSLSELLLEPGDEILVSILEHHSNLLPWQQAAKRKGATLKFLECDEEGNVTEEKLAKALEGKVKLVAITHMSNLFGKELDVSNFAKLCHEKGAVIVVDGAQSVPHLPVNVKKLDIDFLAFSGHKMLAPMGIGVLYGKQSWLEKMPPFLTGGEMIESVSRCNASFSCLPHKFEAGTVNAGGAVALAEAIRYLQSIGFEQILQREEELTTYAMNQLTKLDKVHLLGSKLASEHHGILTFTVEGVHPHDVATILASDNIAVRAGHHCAQPLHQHLGIFATTRASLSFYNTEEEIDRFIHSLSQVRRKMGYGE